MCNAVNRRINSLSKALLTGARLRALTRHAGTIAACVLVVAAGMSWCRCARAAQLTAAENPSNWPGHGGGADESSYSRLNEINDTNVGRLGLQWSLDLEGERSLEATPLAIDGKLYFSGSLSAVYAVDAQTGQQLWRYDPEIWNHFPQKMRYIFGVNRGVAYADGKVFVGTLDGRLIALDANSGKVVWSTPTLDAATLDSSTGAPRIAKNMVLIGSGGADLGARGFVSAYDIHTGQRVWRFYTVPGSPAQNSGDPAMERAAKTWSGAYWNTGTGGTVWNGITFDPELNQIYIGTGNAGPYDPAVRSPGDGDNLYLASIVAVNADTGKYIWHYQVNPREAWDYKATANMISATLSIDGRARKVLMQAPTNGFFYVLDRTNGKLLSAEKIGKVTWAERIDLNTGRPVERPNIRYQHGPVTMYPGPYGAHNWQSMSYNPGTGLVYIPYMQMGARFSKTGPTGGADPITFGGVTIEMTNEQGDKTAALLAWDPVAQKARWRVPHATFLNGGTFTSAGNLVFQGTGDGKLSAYRASDGELLWSFNAGLGIISDPMTYSVDGKQLISILVGYGGATAVATSFVNYGWKFNAQPRRILTFALDGKAKLPPTAPPNFEVDAVDDPGLVLDESNIARGAQHYNMNCIFCHGLNASSPGVPGPDLRESQLALDEAAFEQVVLAGALSQRGMPKFDNLSKTQASEIRSYIRAKAREALGKRKPSQQRAAGRF